jgi:hypothetical protein
VLFAGEGAAGLGSGADAQGSLGGGVFLDEYSGVPEGALVSYATTANFGSRVLQYQLNTAPPGVVGAYAGVGFSGMVTNARSADQLSGPFTTRSVNVGIGPFRFSASLSTGGGSGNQRRTSLGRCRNTLTLIL